MKHKHSVYDTDAHFSINPFTRAIKNESTSKVAVIQHDHNSERFTFEIPRRVDGHDMSVCDRVEVHYINMDSTNAENISADIYEVDDLDVSPDDSGFVICSWLLSQNATKYAGSLNFLVRFICLADDGSVAYAWHTAVFTGISVSSGILNNAEEIIEPYVDVLAQWKADLFGVGDTQEQRLLTVSAEQQAAIAAKGAAVLDSIPDEYEALQAQADENTRIKAGAIVLDAEGESIVVNDASDCYLQGLKLFGKSTQDGTPTPDAPVDIVSVDKPKVSLHSKNLIPFPYKDTTTTKNGVTFTVNNDGSIHLKGTAEKATNFSVFSGSLPLSGIFTLSGVTNDTTPSTHYMQPYVDDVFQSSQTNGSQTYEINGNLTAISLYVKSGETVDCVVRPQLEIGSIATEYEAPTMLQTVETSHTLPGIPVASGGNYTDANGQQWICDEVDLKRGVYVQRVGVKKLTGTEAFEDYIADNNAVTLYLSHKNDSDFICTHAVRGAGVYWANTSRIAFRVPHFGVSTLADFKNFVIASYNAGTPVVVYYMLATHIETPLSDAEITAFKALHGNKPNTTVLNDAGAFMAVEYVADTKTYIDNKIKELMEGVTA